MSTVDLSIPPAPPTGLLEALPRRVTLTLPELRLVAERAGGAPLPFDVVPPTAPRDGGLEGRLGESRASLEDTAYATATAALHDPAVTLTRRGLLGSGGVEDGLCGAVGLLATPETALDLDVTAVGIRARAWHRQSGDAVATLSTVDGLVFELAWFPTTQWAAELGRAAVLPEELQVRASEVPHHVDLPYELADAAAEAVRSGRSDLVPVLAARHPDEVRGGDGALAPEATAAVLLAMSAECQGRLRVLAARVGAEESGPMTVVGVVSWTLLADGWHALRPREAGELHRVVVSAVEPSDLARELAPVLAEVTR